MPDAVGSFSFEIGVGVGFRLGPADFLRRLSRAHQRLWPKTRGSLFRCPARGGGKPSLRLHPSQKGTTALPRSTLVRLVSAGKRGGWHLWRVCRPETVLDQ